MSGYKNYKQKYTKPEWKYCKTFFAGRGILFWLMVYLIVVLIVYCRTRS